MKIYDIITESTTSGSVAPVSSPIGGVLSRSGKKAGTLFKGKKTNKPFYEEAIKEEDLSEEDKILAPGKGNRVKPGLLSKPQSSINPTDSVKIDIPLLIRLLEYAREDASDDLDLHDLAEKLISRGKRGKTLTMKDYEYVTDPVSAPNRKAKMAEGRGLPEEITSGGVIAGGGVGESRLEEKAVSKAQQKFMGMVHAAQKGEHPASKEVAKVAKTMGKKDAKDFASTKHKGLPQHVSKKGSE